MRWQALVWAAVITMFIGIGCGGGDGKKKKNDDGGDTGADTAGDTGTGTGTGGTGGDFDFAQAGVLALDFGSAGGDLGGGADLANFTPPIPEIPPVAPAVAAATPGTLLIDSLNPSIMDINCDSYDNRNLMHAFACRALNDGAAGYPFVLEEVDGRLEGIFSRLVEGNNGALCLEVPRTEITIDDIGIDFTQELSCFDLFNDNNNPDGDGVAFGVSSSNAWIRLTGGYAAANIDLDANNEAENVEVWSVGTDEPDSQVTHIKSTGTTKVEIRAAGDNLNEWYYRGVQVQFDNENGWMYLRGICSDENGSMDRCPGNTGLEFVNLCSDTADNDVTDDDTGSCPAVTWESPFMYIDGTGVTLPAGSVQITEAEIPNFGASTDAAAKALMTTRNPDPRAVIRDLLTSTASTSIANLLQEVDDNLTMVEGWVTNDPQQCLVELPQNLDITTPYDLDLPVQVSCAPQDDQGWTLYGQANGVTSFANYRASSKEGNLVRFDANGTMDAWVVRPRTDEESAYRIRRWADGGAEFTGMLNNSELECGFQYRSNGVNFYVKSTFNAAACSDGPPAEADVYERCVTVGDLSYTTLDVCQDAGLDIVTLTPFNPGEVQYQDVQNMFPATPTFTATPTGGNSVDTTTPPPVATAPVPDTGDGTVDTVPIRNNNIRIPKISGGGLNYGRNCRNETASGDNTADGAYEYAFTSLSAEQLTALQSQITAGDALVSFNFSQDTTIIGNSGAAAARDMSMTISLVDAAGTALTTATFDNATLANGSFVALSVLAGQTVAADQKIVANVTGTATVTCPSDSGQAHIAAGISDLRLRF